MRRQRTKQQLEELVNALAWNDAFGCFTRAGFEKLIWPEIVDGAEWIIFFDVDGVHALNEKHGTYDVFDAMMKDVLSTVRSSDYIAGQLNSGDEFLVCTTGVEDRAPVSPDGIVVRLKAELKKHGLSATFAIVPVISSNLLENVAPAIEEVYAAKKQRISNERRNNVEKL